MLKNYVLGTEVAQKGNFHIANISMILNNSVLIEGADYLKFGGITLLSKQSLNLPKYIRDIVNNNDMTDLSDYIPSTFFLELLENNTKLIKELYEEMLICGKKFIKPKGILKEILLNTKLVKSVVNKNEIKELYKDELIIGDIQISKSKHLVWY